jgi:uncharacterized phage-associated protein
MALTFDIRKTVSASAYLASKNGNKIEVLYLMKMLYLADRFALLEWQRPITGDAFLSVPYGPIVSRTYDLARGRIMGAEARIWKAAFTEKVGNFIHLKEGADMDWLSERERGMLDQSFEKLKNIPPGQMIEVLHRSLPEWKDPKGSCLPIELRSIFLAAGFQDEETNAIVAELDAQQDIKAAIASR